MAPLVRIELTPTRFKASRRFQASRELKIWAYGDLRVIGHALMISVRWDFTPTPALPKFTLRSAALTNASDISLTGTANGIRTRVFGVRASTSFP